MSVAVPVVDSWDGPNRRIYLKQGVTTFHWIEDIYREYRNWRRLDESARVWLPFMYASGNEPKGGGKYTSRYVTLLDGVKVVPYDENIRIEVTGEAITDDADVDPDLFDTSTRTEAIKLYITPPASELVRAEEEIAAVKRMEYSDKVVVDVTSTYSGTLYPVGTGAYPVNNIPNAVQIADAAGFIEIYIVGDITLGNGDFISDMLITGQDQILTRITVRAAADVTNSKFQNCTLTGELDGGNIVTNAIVENINYVNGYMWQCLIDPGTIVLGGNEPAHIMDCWSGQPGLSTPVIDMGGAGQDLGLRNYSGGIKLINQTGNDNISIDLASGSVFLDETVTSGTVVIRGVGTLSDNSGPNAVVHSTGLMSKETISSAVLNTSLVGFDVENSVAAAMKLAAYDNKVTFDMATSNSGTVYPTGTVGAPVNNLDDAVTIATILGFHDIHFLCNHTFDETVYISNFNIHGEGQQETTLTMISGSILANCSIHSCTVTGDFFGINHYDDCVIEDWYAMPIMAISGTLLASHCSFRGTIASAPNLSGEFDLFDCYGLPDENGSPPTIDLMGCNASIQIRNYAGLVKLANVTKEVDIRMFLSSGGLELLPSVTAGNYTVSGPGTLVDNSTSWDSMDTSSLVNVSTMTDTLKFSIENLRSRSPGIGTTYYFDPVNGDDIYEGATPDRAKATFSGALSLCGDGTHDIIQILDTGHTGVVEIDEFWVIDKKDISVRAPGWDIILKPTVSGMAAITITAEECSLERFKIDCDNKVNMGIYTNTNTCTFNHIKIARARNHGIHLDDCDGSLVRHCIIEHCTTGSGIGIYFSGDSHENFIVSNFIYDNVCGIELADTSRENIIHSNIIHDNSRCGLCIEENASHTYIYDDNIFANNTLDIDDNGTGTYYKEVVDAVTIADTVWNTDTSGNTVSGTFGAAVTSSQDLTDISNKIDAIYNKLPAGTIASAGEYDADLTTIKDDLERILGLTQENYYVDQTSYVDYNGAKLMTAGRMRIYSDAVSVGTANNVLATYQVTTDWSNDEMTSYKVIKV